MTILKESGGLPFPRLISAKRSFYGGGGGDDGGGGGGGGGENGDEDAETRTARGRADMLESERLTKRLRGVSLKDKFSSLRR